MVDDALARRILTYASISGAIGVAVGAFGAHYLPVFLDQYHGMDAELIAKRAAQFDTGVRYHLIHSVALLALASVPYGPPVSRRWTARAFLLGIIVFSGSLYALVISNITKFGIITPIGGVTWITAWFMLLWIINAGRPKQKRFAQIRGRTP